MKIWDHSITSFRFLMPRWRIYYFHRTFFVDKDYNWQYKVNTYYLRWRFSIWLGYYAYHILIAYNFTPLSWRIK